MSAKIPDILRFTVTYPRIPRGRGWTRSDMWFGILSSVGVALAGCLFWGAVALMAGE